MSPRRPFLEVLAGAVLRRPYDDAEGRKGLLGLIARAQRHVVRHHALTLPGWPRFSRPLRIAFLSDFHVGSHTGDVARLAAVAAEVAIAFSGPGAARRRLYEHADCSAAAGCRRRPSPASCRGWRRPAARFGVLGNHDYVYGKESVAAALARRRDRGARSRPGALHL